MKLLYYWFGMQFTKEYVREIQNDINKRWNAYTKSGKLCTIAVQTVYMDGTEKNTWVEVPKTNIKNISFIRIFEVKQNVN